MQIPADETTPVEPGDVVRVDVRNPVEAAHSEATGDRATSARLDQEGRSP